MHLPSDVVDGLFTPRTALYASLALVFAGSVLASLSTIDALTGAIVVGVGLAGVAASLVGRGADAGRDGDGG